MADENGVSFKTYERQRWIKLNTYLDKKKIECRTLFREHDETEYEYYMIFFAYQGGSEQSGESMQNALIHLIKLCGGKKGVKF